MSDRKKLRDKATRAQPLVMERAARRGERYSQHFPKVISMEGWLKKAHRDAPALPWLGDQGEVVCSFAVVPLSEIGGLVVVLFDGHGRELTRSGDGRAILATCLALNTTPWELTFLPTAGPRRAAVLLSDRMRARVRKPMDWPQT